MEFLRFGSSIPGSYWGCCAIDIIQNFKVDPDAPATIECVTGDGGQPMLHPSGGSNFIGKTWREIFEQRLRIATFNSNDMPNHMFLASFTAGQCAGGVGQKWLKILHEHGFEFIRCVSNSVYTGPKVASKVYESKNGEPVYLFGLFRNVGTKNVSNMFEPPKAWLDMGGASYTEVNSLSGRRGKKLTKEIFDVTLEKYKSLPPKKFYSEKELEGVPIWRAGVRNKYPQELDKFRKQKTAKTEAKTKEGLLKIQLEAAG